jgi:RimJ/RimL family protein N-acetyltransferase
MDNFWQGIRIRLRAIEPKDAELFIQWNLNSERGRYLDFLWPPQSFEAVRAWTLQQSQNKFEKDVFHWMIESIGCEPVGTIDTHDCNPHNGTFSFGIDIAVPFRRRGYAAEAIGLVLSYYFNELRYQKVTVPVHSDNQASIALHEKLGFGLEGRFRRMMFTKGEYIDVLWYGMTVDEFKQSAAFGI